VKLVSATALYTRGNPGIPAVCKHLRLAWKLLVGFTMLLDVLA
jgi:hypothetical protein